MTIISTNIVSHTPIYAIYFIYWSVFRLFFSYRETLPVIDNDGEEDADMFAEEIFDINQ